MRIGAFAALFAVPASCSSSDEGTSALGGSGGCINAGCAGTGAIFDAGPDRTIDVATPDSASGGTGAGTSINPLCEPGSCNPNEVDACIDHEGGAADSSAPEGEAGDAEQAPTPPALEGGDDAAPPPPFGCRVVADGSGGQRAECRPAGAGESGAPCVGNADCAAGYACVGEDGAAQCRKFCCAGNENCSPGQYCAERPVRDGAADAGAALLIPVCIAADGCSLGDPYPCPDATECRCPAGSACTVVRDRTTSCVVPGTGMDQEPCPCAPGHVCSRGTGKCLRLCSTSSVLEACGSGGCQYASYLPDGWGVCVGSSDSGL